MDQQNSEKIQIHLCWPHLPSFVLNFSNWTPSVPTRCSMRDNWFTNKSPKLALSLDGLRGSSPIVLISLSTNSLVHFELQQQFEAYFVHSNSLIVTTSKWSKDSSWIMSPHLAISSLNVTQNAFLLSSKIKPISYKLHHIKRVIALPLKEGRDYDSHLRPFAYWN